MRAIYGGCGLDITLNLKDKEEGNKKEKIECISPQWKKARVTLHILDEVNKNNFKEKGFMEEPGFHIEGKPKGGGPESKTHYDIFITKEIFDKLTNPEGDPIVKGGYYVSRSIYDRVDIKYFAV